MKLYRAIWNVQDAGGIVAPGGLAKLDTDAALSLALLGAIEPDAVEDAPEASEAERAAAILALVPSLAVGDFTNAGLLRAEARKRLAAALGFVPGDDEIKAAGEAYAKTQAEQNA
ncbi:hypothetical protein [Bosea vaviloviae]|uniref:Uncharacterized protein n=1 Tax=Bosea vaviloviae TaxID=1526658 RepID=A0A0N0MB63_9HYPH|nr:hypothetical protein [Bosea vaviloviae]KPH80526.1 hypothetical protein AE618_12145 [Bosea vaviloviae]